jgi:hypothetical protein
MAQVINIISSATIGAATAKLLNISSGSVAYTASSATHTGGLWYACSFTGVTQGSYAFCLYDGGTERAGMLVVIDAADGIWGDLTNTTTPSGTDTRTVTASGSTFRLFKDEAATVSSSVTDQNGNAVDLSSYTLSFVLSDIAGTYIATISSVTVSGGANDTFSVAIPNTYTQILRSIRYSLRETTGNTALVNGLIEVGIAPDA